MSTEPQTTACGRGPDCPKCKGEETETHTVTVQDETFPRPSIHVGVDGGAEDGGDEPYVPMFPEATFGTGRLAVVDAGPQTFTLALEEFQAEINKALNGKAEDKGYSAGGDSGGRPMLDAVALIAGEGTHPIGEILYKVARWKAKRNPEDLVKVAAWAFLLWDQQKREAR